MKKRGIAAVEAECAPPSQSRVRDTDAKAECATSVAKAERAAPIVKAECGPPSVVKAARATIVKDERSPKRPAKRAAVGPLKLSFEPEESASVPPHTLLLGTQPSDNSLRAGQYFMTNENAFWWIVGDALGFTRDFFVNARTAPPPSIAPHLRAALPRVGYADALAALTGAGYALWDMVASSRREGSLDGAITAAELAGVEGFVRARPSIRRIGFATGKDSAARFRTAFAAWLREPGQFVAAPDAASQAVFASVLRRAAARANAASSPPRAPIELVVLESVSPAYIPRPAWSAECQRARGFDDAYAREPVPAYVYKRGVWFERVFAREEGARRLGSGEERDRGELRIAVGS